MAQRNARTSLKDFEIPMGSWEQIAQERSKWRGLINEEAAFYEKNLKLKESAEKAKPRPIGHQQVPWHWLAQLATDSLELELA